MKSKIFCPVLILVLVLGLSASAFADMGSSNYRIPVSVLSGGGAIMQSGSYQLNFTVGQPSPLMSGVQMSYSTNHNLYHGFWYTTKPTRVRTKFMPWIPLLLLGDED
jgi:hypothetical protein